MKPLKQVNQSQNATERSYNIEGKREAIEYFIDKHFHVVFVNESFKRNMITKPWVLVQR